MERLLGVVAAFSVLSGACARDVMPRAATAASGPPMWFNEMRGDDAELDRRHQPDGAVYLGAADSAAGDGAVARLELAGDAALTSRDRVGPGFASELATARADFHYGVYRARVRLATCDAGEEVVSAMFTYFNDGTDVDHNGLVDNSEIDIEVLCGSPTVVFVTVWTDYSASTGEFRKWTRAIDLATGDVWASLSATEHGLAKVRTDPALVLPRALAPETFVELGFEWRADRVRFFVVADGSARTLAELADPSRIPVRPARLMFNVWHPGRHWFGPPGSPDYPAADAVMLVDWARYWPADAAWADM